MFDWKLIVTLLIVFMVLLFVLGSDSSVSKFFSGVFSKVGIEAKSEDNTMRNVSFSLSAGGYDNISFSADYVKFSIEPQNFSAVIEGASVETKSHVDIEGFRGSGNIDKNVLSLEGSLSAINLSGTSITYAKGVIKATAAFDSLEAGLAVGNLVLSNGVLDINGNEIRFSEITIASPKGKFSFGKELKIEGVAGRIEIPSAKIVIG